MDRRTVQSAHTRIDGLDQRVVKVEVQLEERWKETILRIKRIESVLMGSAATIIAMLVAVIMKMG
jgi:hypothetical protein